MVKENSLIQRCLAGDQTACAELYAAHRAQVRKTIFFMVRDEADADDLTQETFAQAFRNLAQFRGDSQFSTWLYRIACNTVFMFRRKRLPVTVSYDAPILESGKGLDVGAEDRALAGVFEKMRLKRALGRLTPTMRNAIVQHRLLGREHREIAAVIGITVAGSKSRDFHALRKLREALA